MFKQKNVYWIVVFMAFLATALSFLDRQVLSVSIIRIREDFPISDTDYGFINTGFLVSYAIMFTLGGILIDRFGSRKGLGYSVGIWSLATALHSVATNAFHFGIYRFFLGLGEGGAFPGAIKAVVEWVPKKKQALANGIAIGGSALGAVAAPPLCVYLIGTIGWRGVFLVTGIFGLLWVLVWFLLPKNKAKAKRDLKEVKSWAETFRSVGKILKIKEVWIFILIRFILDPIFYFYMFWIPKYLSDSRGVDLEKIGELFWIPFLALGISNMLGGFFSDKVFRSTGNLDWARKGVMGVAAILTLSALFVKYMPSEEWVIVIMVVAFFAHGLWITNYITAISDTFGKSITSTVIGLSGSAGALSSVLINPLMGNIIEKFSYDPMWIYSGLMYPVAFILFLVLMPKIRQLKHIPTI
ncbi:MFS transporter [Arenibacter sp. M-2]|uniref:Putative sulfoacetate transporter SauU n=1 Tax=Arenibacter algicola TaxID=616991 RepID=A0A221UYP6_9FLAO|nr:MULTISPECIES: MFS transporter [Arenibacter]ASO06477.1 putative sulfoacetate transporter SauU [Arenibacter algicola]MDL5512886.1 MFS transporter [Arenibacter sp. M-2]|tara:strand:+ start:1210 stop:2445 length:1236 start_codon:yes stop_codon:yes gene_type:complete